MNNYIVEEEPIGRGTYGVVKRATDIRNRDVVAMKYIGLVDEEGIPSTALREIAILKALNHPNIIRLIDVLHLHNTLIMIFTYMELDLKKYLDSMPVGEHSSRLDSVTVKSLTLQILHGLKFCHMNQTVHRDMKPANLLLSRTGICVLADFGLSRTLVFCENAALKHEVVTLWYRAPELLLGSINYSIEIDLWSVGCILMEMSTTAPLFPGQKDVWQLELIFELLGISKEEYDYFLNNVVREGPLPPQYLQILDSALETTDAKIHSGEFENIRDYRRSRIATRAPLFKIDNSGGIDLVLDMLEFIPHKRITAEQAIASPFFLELMERDYKLKHSSEASGVNGDTQSALNQASLSGHPSSELKTNPAISSPEKTVEFESGKNGMNDQNATGKAVAITQVENTKSSMGTFGQIPDHGDANDSDCTESPELTGGIQPQLTRQSYTCHSATKATASSPLAASEMIDTMSDEAQIQNHDSQTHDSQVHGQSKIPIHGQVKTPAKLQSQNSNQQQIHQQQPQNTMQQQSKHAGTQQQQQQSQQQYLQQQYQQHLYMQQIQQQQIQQQQMQQQMQQGSQRMHMQQSVPSGAVGNANRQIRFNNASQQSFPQNPHGRPYNQPQQMHGMNHHQMPQAQNYPMGFNNMNPGMGNTMNVGHPAPPQHQVSVPIQGQPQGQANFKSGMGHQQHPHGFPQTTHSHPHGYSQPQQQYNNQMIQQPYHNNAPFVQQSYTGHPNPSQKMHMNMPARSTGVSGSGPIPQNISRSVPGQQGQSQQQNSQSSNTMHPQ